jgi:hypothetical protein
MRGRVEWRREERNSAAKNLNGSVCTYTLYITNVLNPRKKVFYGIEVIFYRDHSAVLGWHE